MELRGPLRLNKIDHMLKIGDIVTTGSKPEAGTALIIGRCGTSDTYTCAAIADDIKTYSSKQFTEIICQDDLEEGTLNNDAAILLDRLSTIAPDNASKVARIHKQRLDKILRTFSHYAGYSHYQAMTDENKGSYIPTSGKILDDSELNNMLDASLDMWLTTGRFNDEFEAGLVEFLGTKYALTTGSGSSANLLAVSALTSHELGEKRLRKGDEIITVAAAFPTTVMPIIQNGLVPVFVDVDTGTCNINADLIEDALSERTKAIFLAHTLGNPFDIEKVMEICRRHNLFLIEDNCDALGSRYRQASGKSGFTGTFGDIGTLSFYPAHHITTGEGGAVVTKDPLLKKILLSLRDWGRDCWCPPGRDDTCGKRFTQQHGKLPEGFDHKYVYSHPGYNLKMTDWQAAIGVAQLKKLPGFIEKRRENFRLLYEGLKPFENKLILPLTDEKSEPAWFGFPVTVRENAGFKKNALVTFLEENNIGTREFFAGNILKQPVFINNRFSIRIGSSGLLDSSELTQESYKMLPNTEQIMNSTFWIGTWPGLDRENIEHVIKTFGKFL